jgi:hypothetical protein
LNNTDKDKTLEPRSRWRGHERDNNRKTLGVKKTFEPRRHETAGADTKDTKESNNRKPFVNLRALRAFVVNVFFLYFLMDVPAVFLMWNM